MHGPVGRRAYFTAGGTYRQGTSKALALRRAIQRAYKLDHAPDEEEIAEVADRWRPYRSLAVSYLFASEYQEGT